VTGRRVRLVHQKAVHYPGPVCGAHVPDTAITEDPQGVTCQDCQSDAELEAEPNDATAAAPRLVDLLREVVAGHNRKIDGVLVDPSTAHLILLIAERLSPAKRATFLAEPMPRMAAIAWKIAAKHSR
jgi:hypothetical protein